MALNRRRALAAGGSSLLAACSRRALTRPASPIKARPLDPHVLDQGFPALAARARPGALAIGVMDLQTNETWYWNTDRAFPLASAVALPVAAAALAQVDAGRLALAEPVPIRGMDLAPPPSIIDAKWPTPPGDHSESRSVQDLMSLALIHGDNTAIDVLMGRIGGPGAVTAWLQFKGVSGMRVDRYMREIGVELFGMPTFRPEWKDEAAFDAARSQVTPQRQQAAMDAFIVDPRDSSTVPAALGFLAMMSAHELLSRRSQARLLSLMYAAPGGLFRSGLPREVAFARVLGATPLDLGYTPALAEIGLATWPGGRSYVLAGFLAGSTATADQRNALFADAARLASRAVA